MTDYGTCKYCNEPAAHDCGRCDDPDCNAGCIFCRPKAEWDWMSRTISDHPLSSSLLIVAYFTFVYLVSAR